MFLFGKQASLVPAITLGMMVFSPSVAQFAMAQKVAVRFQDDAPAAADAEVPKGEPVNVEAEVRKELARIVAEDVSLHGAWATTVRPDPNDKTVILLDLIVDEDRADAQKSKILSTMKGFLEGTGAKTVIESVKPLPFTTLMADIQSELEDHAELLGSQITDAYYMEKDGALFLNLMGRVANDEQADAIADVANQVIAEVLGNETKVEITSLSIVAPSPAVGRYFFNHGTMQFAKKDYESAAKSFSHAILEDPEILPYQYWKILCEIGMGQEDRALKQLKPLVARRRTEIYGTEYLDVLWSLEHVQGTIRRQLVKLEEQAWDEGN